MNWEHWLSSITWKQGDTYSSIGESRETSGVASLFLELGVINFSRSSSLDSSNCKLQVTIFFPVWKQTIVNENALAPDLLLGGGGADL